MASSQLYNLTTCFSERYAVFLKYLNRQKEWDWINESFGEEITSQLVDKELFEGKNFTLSVLGIGSGDGKFEVEMLLQLLKKFRLIECTVVEPSAERIACYKVLVEEMKDALNSVTFKWRQETLQEFYKTNTDGTKKFHFVSAVHSLYYIPKEDLNFYLSAITSWCLGRTLIIQDAESTLVQIRKELTIERSPLLLETHGNEIMDSLKSLGINFEMRLQPRELDLTCCFEKDSQDGKLLLVFLFTMLNPTYGSPPELTEMARERLKSVSNSYTRNGRLYIPYPANLIIISTSKQI